MKSLLEIKKDLVEKPDEIWEDIFKKLHSKFFGWGIKNVEYRLYNTSFFNNNNFEAEYIKVWIYHVLKIPANELYKDIFKIEKEITGEESYHGSRSNYTNISINFILNEKEKQLSKISGDWIWNNLKETEEFMRDNNLIYNRLKELRDIFPIWGIVIK